MIVRFIPSNKNVLESALTAAFQEAENLLTRVLTPGEYISAPLSMGYTEVEQLCPENFLGACEEHRRALDEHERRSATCCAIVGEDDKSLEESAIESVAEIVRLEGVLDELMCTRRKLVSQVDALVARLPKRAPYLPRDQAPIFNAIASVALLRLLERVEDTVAEAIKLSRTMHGAKLEAMRTVVDTACQLLLQENFSGGRFGALHFECPSHCQPPKRMRS